MTCEKCVKFNDCKDENSITQYYGERIACDNVEVACKDFISYDKFTEEYCRLCGTQRCPGDEDAIQTCGHFKEMNKVFEERAKMIDKQIHTSRIMMNEAETDFILTCDCGCGNSLRLTLEPYNIDDEHRFSVQILSDEYYNRQKRTLSNIIKERLKHIWNIIRGKDFLYFDIELDKDSFHDFRNAVDKLDDKEN